MATHSSTLAWRIPWTEEPGRPWSMGSQRVRHDWVTEHARANYKNCKTTGHCSRYHSCFSRAEEGERWVLRNRGWFWVVKEHLSSAFKGKSPIFGFEKSQRWNWLLGSQSHECRQLTDPPRGRSHIKGTGKRQGIRAQRNLREGLCLKFSRPLLPSKGCCRAARLVAVEPCLAPAPILT